MLDWAAKPIGLGAQIYHNHALIPRSLAHGCGRRLGPNTTCRRCSHSIIPSLTSASYGAIESNHRRSSLATARPLLVHPVPKPWRYWRPAVCQSVGSTFSRETSSKSRSPPRHGAPHLRYYSGNTISTATPSQNLRKLQSRIDKSKGDVSASEAEESTWELFTALPEHEKTPALVQALIPLLTSSSAEHAADRIIPLFEAIDVPNRQPSIYPIVIRTLLDTGRIGKAVAIVDSALSARVSPFAAGVDALLEHLVFRRQWQFVFHVFHQCLESFPNPWMAEKWCNDLFARFAQLPAYTSHVSSLFKTLQDFPNAISPEADAVFINKAVEYVFRTDISSESPGDKQSGFVSLHEIGEVLSTLADMRVLYYRTFSAAIYNCLLKFPNASPSERLQTAAQIYSRGWQYKDFLQGPDLMKIPQHDVLYHLLYAAALARDRHFLNLVDRDLHTHHGVPGRKETQLLVRGYAETGSIDIALKAFREFFSVADGRHDDSLLDQHVFSTMLHAYALRADPNSVKTVIEELERNKGLKPDLVCWNCLLHAYCRSNDLHGAVQTYSDLISAGLQPDQYTYGTLLSLIAERGDLVMVRDLWEAAKQNNVRLDIYSYSAVVTAYLNRQYWVKAKNFAISSLHDLQPLERTYLFNQLLRGIFPSTPARVIASIKQLMRFMQGHDVPLDSYSYTSLMRAYCSAGQSDLAKRVLFDTLLVGDYEVTAFHFAIVMDGYADQGAFAKGLSLHAQMLEKGIKADVSSNIVLMKIHSLAAKQKVIRDKVNKPLVRLDIPQELLHELVQGWETEPFWSKAPALRSLQYKGIDAYPAAYFDTLLTIYSRHGSHDLVEALIEQFFQKASEVQGTTDLRIPFRLMGIIMTHNYRKSNHEQVDKYWKTINDHAVQITTTGTILTNPSSERQLVPLKYRSMLSRPLDVYMRSLASRGFLSEVRATIDEVLAQGFSLDNTNWNHYVYILIKNGLYEEAFTITETHLVPLFEEQYKRRRAIDNPRNLATLLTKQQALDYKTPRAQYRVMLALGKKVSELRGAFHSEKNFAKGRLLQRLQEVAPRTMKAALKLRKDAYGQPMVKLVQQEIKPFAVRDEYGEKILLGPRKRRALRSIWSDALQESPTHAQPAPSADVPIVEEVPFEDEPPPDYSTVFLSVYPRSPLNRIISLPPDFWQGG